MKLLPLLLFPNFILLPIITLDLKPATAIVQPADAAKKAQVDELIAEGIKLYRKSDYPAALDKFQQGLTIAKAINYKEIEGTTVFIIGHIYELLGEYPKALEYYQQFFILSKASGNKSETGAVLNSIAVIYHSLGQYLEALEYFQKSLTTRRELGDKYGEGNTLSSIGSVYKSLGKYPKALEYYQQSLAISQSISNKKGESTTLRGIAGVFRSLGKYPKALEYYQQSLTIEKAIRNKAGEGTTLNNIGVVYSDLKQYSKALDYYQQALDIRRAIHNKAGEGTTLGNIGAVYKSLEQYPKALEYFQQSLSISKIAGDKSGEVVNLNNIAEVYKSLREYAKALAYEEQSLVIAKVIGNLAHEGDILTNIGGNFLAQQKPALAEKSLRQAIAIWETIRGSKDSSGQGLSDSDKVSFSDRVAVTYRLLQQALIEQNKPQEALEVSEKARARALAELLASKIITTNTASSQAIRQAPNLVKIQQIAKAKQATLVQYSIINDELIYIWVVKPSDEIVFKQSKLPANTRLQDLIVATRQNIGAEARPPEQENLPEPPGDLQQLYKLLMEPIAKDLPTNPEAEVIILPQRELFLVPFAALQDPQEKYLIEKHTLTIAPSIQVLGLTNTKRSKHSGKPVVVGNPIMPTDYKNQAGEPVALADLPGSEAEAKTVAEILQVTPLIGKAADKQQVVKFLQDSPIVHLATHGLLGTLKGDIPGAIVLTNGFLTASEIFDMQLQADLVVLSACDTGRGDLTGDGVVGLSRSLAVAGVPSVIVSLWEVSDDATKALMSEFYRNLRVKKLVKSQALRQAMLTTMQEYPKPVLWSAFMLVGEGH
jgi:CHAT domain-containing protein/Tfp pilus assembly protein PilF